MKTSSRVYLGSAFLVLAALGLSCFRLVPVAQAQTPSPTPSYYVWLPLVFRDIKDVPVPTVTATLPATATATPEPSSTPTASPTASSTVTGTPVESTATATPSPTPTEGATATGTVTPSATPTSSVTPTATATASPTATSTPTATPAPSATPTASPTPTSTACSATNVTGTYSAGITNVVAHDCPFGPPVIEAGVVSVTQNGTNLSIRIASTDATGTIDPSTGAFTAVGPVPSSSGCPPLSTCTNTTTGAFSIGQTPMTFTGTGRIDITGLVRCYITYDTSGTRTSCTANATQAADSRSSALGRLLLDATGG